MMAPTMIAFSTTLTYLFVVAHKIYASLPYKHLAIDELSLDAESKLKKLGCLNKPM